jgi:hypothetical protein
MRWLLELMNCGMSVSLSLCFNDADEIVSTSPGSCAELAGCSAHHVKRWS